MQNSFFPVQASSSFIIKRTRASKKKTLIAIITIYAAAGAMAFIAFSASRSAGANPAVSNLAR